MWKIEETNMLTKATDCIKFNGTSELPLCRHNKSSDSANPGVFWGPLEFASKLDENFKIHFETGTVFKENSKTIQNEFLNSAKIK
jgi:hypothetical protein